MKHGVAHSYCGWISDESILLSSSSGGFAYALGLKFIESGGVVYSVKWSSDFRTGLWARACTAADLRAFQGSKYVESRKVYENFNLYASVKEDLENGSSVLVIGLPCDIGAVRASLKKDYENLFCVDLICHGPAVRKVAADFLDSLEKKYSSSIVDFSVRYKREGNWTPPYLRAVFANGKTYMEQFYSTDYGVGFSIASKPACFNCSFKGEHHVSDLTIGDYWGVKSGDANWNPHGVSICFVRNERGETLVDSIRDVCEIRDADMDLAMEHNPMLNVSRTKSPIYDKFMGDLEEKGLRYAVSHRYSPARRILQLAKRLVKKIVKAGENILGGGISLTHKK